MSEIFIKASKLKKVYKLSAEDVVALKEVDFEIKKGEFVAVMGPSGSGKTTFLDLVSGLDRISSGGLEILGEDISSASEKSLLNLRRQKLGFVFQRSFLLPTLTALENVELPLIFAGQKKDKQKSLRLLEKVGLGHRVSHLPNQLSGGEMQRVAVARALVTSPEILLADEPTGNLDARNSQGIFDLLKQLNQEGLTILVATHDENLGSQAGRILHLDDGRIRREELLSR